jgi:hypothetical protein
VVIGFNKLTLEDQLSLGYEPETIPDPIEPEPPTPQQTQEEIQQAIQDMLDNKAREYEFESIHTAGVWRGLRPHADGLVVWGASCWNKGDEIRAAVIAGERTMPTVNQVLAEMPIFEVQP